MDISAFDMRSRAEEGIFVPLQNPITGEPIGSGEDIPGFFVRGTAAKSVQDRLGALMEQAAKNNSKKEKVAMMESIHKSLIDQAMSFIISAKNIEFEGREATSAADYRKVLNMTFPGMGDAVDEDGKTIMIKVKNDDGVELEIPKPELKNKPFARQVIDAAEDSSRFLGNLADA